MKTKHALLIDKTIIRFLVLWLNVLVRLVGWLLKIDHSLNRNFKTIAVCKFKGMGSIIQATPLLFTLRQSYPEARIVFISTIGNEAILREINLIDQLILLDDRSFARLFFSFPRFITKLILHRFEVYLDLEIYSDFSSMVTTLSLSRNRFGYYLRSSQYRMGVYTHMMYFNIQSPIYQTYLQMSRLLGCVPCEDLYSFTNVESEPLPNELQRNNYIVINPNASDLRIERRWSGNRFIELVKRLRNAFPGKGIAFVGSHSERGYVESLINQLEDKDRIFNFAGKTKLKELIVLIKNAELLITNDTGPMHLAYATQIPVVALFGPCSPVQYGHQGKVVPIYHKVYCSPCVHEFPVPPCKGNNHCMKQIQVEEVFSAAKKILENIEILSTKSQGIIFSMDNRVLGLVYR